MTKFPRKNIIATTHIYKFDKKWAAYLKTQSTFFAIGNDGITSSNGYVPSEAKQVEFQELPDLAQDYFVDVLSNLDIPLNSRGLNRLPELVKVDEIGDFIIWQKRIKMRKANFRIYHAEQEVHKAETLAEATKWVEDNNQNS